MRTKRTSSRMPDQRGRAMVAQGQFAQPASAVNAITMTAARSEIGTSKSPALRAMGTGLMTAQRPRMKSRLKMFEPMTLPTAISLASCRDAVKLTANSGIDVPKATMVRPTRSEGTPRRRERRAEPLTNHSAPKTRHARPRTTSRSAFIAVLLLWILREHGETEFR